PDAQWGQRVVAAVVARGAFDAQALAALARERLAPWKVPKEFVLVERVPRTLGGKVQRALVRNQLLQR
ncbi:MAG TPA: 2-succinylbenzoate-CoA ligase, partial [Candidatus Thermoplasmatota archaeon]|nr:2-succinylbenzoate-CoA ligase [Candidatus Thermoplasmatota archaeon]